MHKLLGRNHRSHSACWCGQKWEISCTKTTKNHFFSFWKVYLNVITSNPGQKRVKKISAENQLNLFTRFDTIPACVRQMEWTPGHNIGCTALCIMHWIRLMLSPHKMSRIFFWDVGIGLRTVLAQVFSSRPTRDGVNECKIKLQMTKFDLGSVIMRSRIFSFKRQALSYFVYMNSKLNDSWIVSSEDNGVHSPTRRCKQNTPTSKMIGFTWRFGAVFHGWTTHWRIA